MHDDAIRNILLIIIAVNFLTIITIQKVTLVHYKSGLLTYLVAGAICIVTGCWCVSLCVLCVDALKDVEHVHPETGQVVGVYKRVEI